MEVNSGIGQVPSSTERHVSRRSNIDLVMYCRQVPLSETTEVARLLANLFSCNFQSLPTELLIHPYWTRMPQQFGKAIRYNRCLRTRMRPYLSRSSGCQIFNPYYCGLWFGQRASASQLTVCRQLLSGADTASYTVPPSVIDKIEKYRTCLAKTRTAVWYSLLRETLYVNIQ